MIVKVINTSESVIYQGKIYSFDDEFEIDDSIGQSLINRKYLAVVSTASASDVIEETETVANDNDIESMSHIELKAYAKKLGLSANGKRDELIARIKEYESGADDSEETIETDSEEIPNTSMPE